MRLRISEGRVFRFVVLVHTAQRRKAHLAAHTCGRRHPYYWSGRPRQHSAVLFTAVSSPPRPAIGIPRRKGLRPPAPGADIGSTYRVLDCPCNLHFMSTLVYKHY